MGNILFTKIRNVKSPTQAYNYPAGTDFYIPEYSKEFYTDFVAKNANKDDYSLSVMPSLDNMTITLHPHGRVNIPSGIRVILDDPNTCLLAVNKSGIAANRGIVVGAQLVDFDYQGEIHLSIINTSDNDVSFKTGDKVVQFMHLPVIYSHYQEVSEEDYYKLAPDTKRGHCGFGSSGT